MSDLPRSLSAGELDFIDEDALADWVFEQRWFASKARDVASVSLLEVVPLVTAGSPLLALALVQSRFPAGTHELYQVLLGARRDSEGWTEQRIAPANGWILYDALTDPIVGLMLERMIDGAHMVRQNEASIGFHSVVDNAPTAGSSRVRPMGADQSNTSIVLDDRLALKVFRRLQPGVNPELEMLRFLSVRGFPHVAALQGWYEHGGDLEATLGILQSYVHGVDGWHVGLDALASEPDRFLAQLGDLGRVTGELHTVLGSDSSDPDFAPEERTDETLALLTATIDEEIERVFTRLPDAPVLAPVAGRGEEVRDRLVLMTQVSVGGKLIRTHGDYHLGQTMLGPEGWVILDFEGEPARPLVDRRRKRSPLRDAAGMLRSFAYLVSAAEQQRGLAVPADWEDRAREAFLDGYFDAVDPLLLPPGDPATSQLLGVFELEKAVYELSYELNHRPDWVGIPVAGIARLLETWSE